MRGAAARFFVSRSSAINIDGPVRATGSVAPARYGGHRRSVLAPHEDLLRTLVAERGGRHVGRDPRQPCAQGRSRPAVGSTLLTYLALIVPAFGPLYAPMLHA